MLYIIRGLPGSGKTTLAQRMSAGSIAHYEADMFFELDGYQFDASKLKQAHEWCYRQTEKQVIEGNDVIVANTFTRLREIQPYVEMAEGYGEFVTIITCTGNFRSVHDVPETTIDKMKARFVSNEQIKQAFGTDINITTYGGDDVSV